MEKVLTCKVCVHMLGVSKVMRGRELRREREREREREERDVPVDLFVKMLDLVFLASLLLFYSKQY